jgi:hypothetical protein
VTNDAGMAVLIPALANDRGLVDLELNYRPISDDNWANLCESLKAHPTLTSLDLQNTNTMSEDGDRIEFPDEEKEHRTRLLADMMELNTVLQTIELSEHQRDEQIYTESILPRLETNRYRPRVLAAKRADISLRRPLLGMALQNDAARDKSNLIWMFLSGNADVVIQTNEN